MMLALEVRVENESSSLELIIAAGIGVTLK